MSNLDSLQRALRSLDGPATLPAAPPGLADRALRAASARRRRNSALAVAGAALAVVAVVLTVVLVPGDPGRPATDTTAASGVFAQPRQNVLIIGSDAAADRVGVRPDTIVLASIDTRTGATTLFGLPRNLEHVPFPAGTAQARAHPDGFTCAEGSCVLNALWAWASGPGAQYYPGDRHPGLTATTQAAEQITGLDVDQTVVLTMTGLQKLVDAVGGVRVTITERLPISGDAEGGCGSGGFLQPGRNQKLDGYHAVWFIRSRCSTSDLDRMGRAQCLIGALTRQADARTLLRSWPRIAEALQDDVSLSMAAGDLDDWAALAERMRDGGVRTVGLFPADRTDPDFGALRDQVTQALQGRPAARPAGDAALPAREFAGTARC